MGTIMLVGAGIFIGWLLFRPQGNPKYSQPEQARTAKGLTADTQMRAEKNPAQGIQAGGRYPSERPQARPESHTLRNVAGGMVAGAVLGHMLMNEHRAEAHQNTNNYNTYNDYYDYDELSREDCDGDEDYVSDYDYDSDDYDSDDYDSYDSHEDDYDSGYDSDYDSSDWGGDSYDDGGVW